jgi:hypothetical protein
MRMPAMHVRYEDTVKLDTLRMIVGFSIITSHIVFFAMILIATENLTSSERVELSLIISPIFAVYVTAIVRRFTQSDANYDTTESHIALRILSIGTSTLFSLVIPITIYLFLIGNITSFSALKSTLGIVETALGIYTGAVIDRLFWRNSDLCAEDLAELPSCTA